MEMKIYSVKDAKVGFTGLSIEKSQLPILRQLEMIVNGSDENSMIAKFPNDFALYELGTIDTDTGAISPSVKFVAEMSSLKKSS